MAPRRRADGARRPVGRIGVRMRSWPTPPTCRTTGGRCSRPSPTEAPMAADWSYEIKWDGIRGLVAVEDGTRHDHEPARQRPVGPVSRARRAGRRRSTRRCCSTARSWRSTTPAARASRRSSSGCTSPTPAARRSSRPRQPVAFMVFDVLWHDGRVAARRRLPGPARRAARARAHGPNWQTPASVQRRRATARRCSRRASSSASRASSPSAARRATSPASGRASG